MRRDYSVGERGTVGQGQAGDRGTVGQGQADVIRQKPVPVTLSLSLSTPQIRRTQTSALQGGRRGSWEISGFHRNSGLLRRVES